MGRWTREHLEEAFDHYQKVALKASTSGEWDQWADLFTEDATYIEHNYGNFAGREAIRRWINEVMHEPVIDQMKYFPIEWYVIDDERGWVVCAIWNRMADPGDGSMHQVQNWTLLKYAGDFTWKYEEDIYNLDEFNTMISGWRSHTRALAAAESKAS